jgi:hypothetical protein
VAGRFAERGGRNGVHEEECVSKLQVSRFCMKLARPRVLVDEGLATNRYETDPKMGRKWRTESLAGRFDNFRVCCS